MLRELNLKRHYFLTSDHYLKLIKPHKGTGKLSKLI
jgi:hypothetical protein